MSFVRLGGAAALLGTLALVLVLADPAAAQNVVLTSPGGTLQMGVDSQGYMRGTEGLGSFPSPSGMNEVGLRYRVLPEVEEYEFGTGAAWGIADNLGQGSTVWGCATHVPFCTTTSSRSTSLPISGAGGPTPVAQNEVHAGPAGSSPVVLYVRHQIATTAVPERAWEWTVTVQNNSTTTLTGLVYRHVHRHIGEPTTATRGYDPAQGEEWLRFDGQIAPPPALLFMQNHAHNTDEGPTMDPRPTPTNWNCLGGAGLPGRQVVSGDPSALPWWPGATGPTGWTGWMGPCNQGTTVELLLGDLAPGASRTFRMYAVAGPDLQTVEDVLRNPAPNGVDAEFWYISTGAATDPSIGGTGAPATFAWGFKGFAPPNVVFTWSPDDLPVYMPPGWTAQNPCVDGPVTFDSQGSTPSVGANLDRAVWDFGDGSPVVTLNPYQDNVSHTFAAAGTFAVLLTLFDDAGNSQQTSRNVTVLDCTPPNLPPAINAPPCRTVHLGEVVRFTVQWADPNGPPSPPAHYTLTVSFAGLPAGASFSTTDGRFSWRADALGDFPMTFRVEDGGSPPLSAFDTTCLNVVPEDASPAASDADGDGATDGTDNCPGVTNDDQADSDGDGRGDACDEPDPAAADPSDEPPGPGGEDPLPPVEDPVTEVADRDRDGIADTRDNCADVPNPDQQDSDRDDAGDACDEDLDGDGVLQLDSAGRVVDNCPRVFNPDQIDRDADGAGDACSGDRDGDGVPDAQDNCLWAWNPLQDEPEDCDAQPAPAAQPNGTSDPPGPIGSTGGGWLWWGLGLALLAGALLAVFVVVRRRRGGDGAQDAT